MNPILRLLPLLVAAGLSVPAAADELMDARVLYKKGDAAAALQRLDAYLATRPAGARGPKIAQAWFLKGVLLAEQNRAADAVQAFSAVIKDYPEHPEAYNNLAVIYAQQGQYDKARATLEAALATHPAYAAAYQNLSAVYQQLAGKAYEQALQTGGSKPAQMKQLCDDYGKISGQALQNKKISRSGEYNLVKTLYGNTGKLAKPAADAALLASAAAAPASAPAAAAQPAAEAKSGTDSAAAAKEEILGSVVAWAAAWSKKNTKAYFAHYANNFKPSDGETRGAWEAGRRERINKPGAIRVNVELPKVTLSDATHASVSFAQRYHSDSLQISTRKMLELEKKNGKWLIVRERVAK